MLQRATCRGNPGPHESMTDERLMDRYRVGDAGAFEELFRRYESRAFQFFLRRTASTERARDLYQELFLRIHRARDLYDASRPFAPWMFQIAHRLLVDDHRRAFRSREIPIEPRDIVSASPDPGEQVASREEMRHALGALSEDERYVLWAARVEGVGYGELAERLGRSAEAVRKLASRAAQRLRALAIAGEVA